MQNYFSKVLKRKTVFLMIGFALIMMAIIAISILINRDKLDLPAPDKVQTMEMEQFNEGSSLGAIMISDKRRIANVVTALNGSRKVWRSSVNDYPTQQNYLIIRLNQKDEMRTLCLYSENESYYIEEPYVGVYSSNRLKSVEIYKIYTEKENE
ncbi:DUF5301 domain-containing protein [Fusibacter ferrireducens]|uniref:DUF5301 domain-containing protein n=1 Tax=Fusibacter ferrireducens TaxID=2785058 RepID=A0ABR9ZYL4_9FIRM|nr:DUF5301 domain-containing protein [Fusibacter ferrireducens]MBF4695563.1 DUF5301 domain-containing protein [Fusibacter ferrireducens]